MAGNWGDDELAAAVAAYKEMALEEAHQRPYSKRKIYRDLAARFDRSEKSFEYRMQNISAVLEEQGREWVPGLKPAGNVGVNVAARIVALLGSFDTDGEAKANKTAAYKAKLPAVRAWLINVARGKGLVTYGQTMAAFGLDRFSLRHAMDILGHQADNLDEPIITALIVNSKTRRCSQGLAKEFKVFDDQAERTRLYEFWGRPDEELTYDEPATTDLEIKAARFVSVESRPDQAAFRRRVFLASSGRCVVSGCDVVKALDAAHKHGRNWRLGHNDGTDGFLLRKDLHALYDSNLLCITDDGEVRLDASVVDHYKHFDGVEIAIGSALKPY